MSSFTDFILKGFQECAKMFSAASSPAQIVFNGQSADVVKGSLKTAAEMKNAGVMPMADETCVLTDTDFQRLGIRHEVDVEVGGRLLTVKDIEHGGPLVVLMLKAVR